MVQLQSACTLVCTACTVSVHTGSSLVRVAVNGLQAGLPTIRPTQSCPAGRDFVGLKSGELAPMLVAVALAMACKANTMLLQNQLSSSSEHCTTRSCTHIRADKMKVPERLMNE